jgi:hypothetical protein
MFDDFRTNPDTYRSFEKYCHREIQLILEKSDFPLFWDYLNWQSIEIDGDLNEIFPVYKTWNKKTQKGVYLWPSIDHEIEKELNFSFYFSINDGRWSDIRPKTELHISLFPSQNSLKKMTSLIEDWLVVGLSVEEIEKNNLPPNT